MVVFSVSSTDDPGSGASRVGAPERRVLEAIDDEETLQLLRELIAEPSENPPGNEEGCARLLASFLEQRGVASLLVEVAPGRPKSFPGTGRFSPAPLPL